MSELRPGPVDYALLTGLAAMWGASFLLSKVAVATVAPLTVTLIRQLVATAMFVGVFVAVGQRQTFSGRDHLMTVLTAAFGTAIPFALITWGLVEIDASIAAILMGLMPLAVLLLAHVTTDDEKLTVPRALGVAVGFGGLIVLFWPDLTASEAAHGGSIWRYVAVLGAALCYAVNALVTRRLRGLRPLPLYALVMAWTVVMLAPFAFMFEAPLDAHPGLTGWLAIVGLGLFPSALGSYLTFLIVSRQGATFFGQINFLVPLFGVLWGALLLGERPGLHAGLALAIILAGVAIARLPAFRILPIERKEAP